MTFSGEIFFSFKSAWIFACAFQLSSTTFPCILFLPGLHFVSEKNKDKIFKRVQWPQQNRTRAFQPQKRCRRMFFYLIKKHMQKFRHFWRKKKFHLKKSLTSLLHQAIQLWEKYVKLNFQQLNETKLNWYQPGKLKEKRNSFMTIDYYKSASQTESDAIP